MCRLGPRARSRAAKGSQTAHFLLISESLILLIVVTGREAVLLLIGFGVGPLGLIPNDAFLLRGRANIGNMENLDLVVCRLLDIDCSESVVRTFSERIR
ncbi:hypothetical protein BKA70DRAFT_1360983 [Coprinopsis sp. MPI-PUGE-AT-0042]|nr:hypothetical protein BKA70DRAFT_1360983 [Coprinopsis sp. MPI-PUGE-AT-0042]